MVRQLVIVPPVADIESEPKYLEQTMPVYEYSCRACEKEFELLVRKQTVVKCPACQSEDLEKLLSLPTVQSSGTKAQAMKAAKKRDAKQGNDRVQTQIEYERNHD